MLEEVVVFIFVIIDRWGWSLATSNPQFCICGLRIDKGVAINARCFTPGASVGVRGASETAEVLSTRAAADCGVNGCEA